MWALGIGALSAVSLPLGSLVGLSTRLRPLTLGLLAAFGAGALLAALLAELRAHNGDTSQIGDPLMIQHRFDNEPEREVGRALGKQFLQSLRHTPLGSWQGPIVSGFGLHLVHLTKRTDGKVPALAEVRDAVRREWSAAKRKQTNEAFYEALRARYKVTVVRPTTPTSPQVDMTETVK